VSVDTASLQAIHGGRILRLYHLYRLIIGQALVLLISSELDHQLLNLADQQLFRYGSWLYLLLNILIFVLAPQPRRLAHLFSLALLDVLLLSGLFYAAGGTPSGIGNLLIVAVAIANILLRGRIGVLIAAIAAICITYLTFYLSLGHPAASANYLQAGTLGALCFAAALVVQGLTRRALDSENLAEQRACDVANLEALNAQILQRMRTGILVLDTQHRVLLANQGAKNLLRHENLTGQILSPYCPELITCLQQWLRNPTLRPSSLQTSPTGPVLQPSFVSLQSGTQQHRLIFLEDASQVAQQAQQLKLASLGRLTASIAHEVRNPLGAISHAAQLLQESATLEGPDLRLTQIIQDQSKRMNRVIENVLQLSRRRPAEPQRLNLNDWLQGFAREFRSAVPVRRQLHLETKGRSLQTRMDPHQLTQVLTNLVENGLRHSLKKHPQAQVWLSLFRDPGSDLPVLEVLDDGDGVPPEQLQHIFEPFYTTENKGTGLGLYISRELCESNQAHIDYKTRDSGGSCFRITFAHPRKLS